MPLQQHVHHSTTCNTTWQSWLLMQQCDVMEIYQWHEDRLQGHCRCELQSDAEQAQRRVDPTCLETLIKPLLDCSLRDVSASSTTNAHVSYI